MSKESEIKEKLNNLFKEQKKVENDFEEIYTSPQSKLALEDFSEQEKKEVEEAVRDMYDRAPARPNQQWKWSFTGRLLIKVLFYVLEFIIWLFLLKFILPIAINTDITIAQSLCGTLILSYFRFWWK